MGSVRALYWNTSRQDATANVSHIKTPSHITTLDYNVPAVPTRLGQAQEGDTSCHHISQSPNGPWEHIFGGAATAPHFYLGPQSGERLGSSFSLPYSPTENKLYFYEQVNVNLLISILTLKGRSSARNICMQPPHTNTGTFHFHRRALLRWNSNGLRTVNFEETDCCPCS